MVMLSVSGNRGYPVRTCYHQRSLLALPWLGSSSSAWVTQEKIRFGGLLSNEHNLFNMSARSMLWQFDISRRSQHFISLDWVVVTRRYSIIMLMCLLQVELLILPDPVPFHVKKLALWSWLHSIPSRSLWNMVVKKCLLPVYGRILTLEVLRVLILAFPAEHSEPWSWLLHSRGFCCPEPNQEP